MPIDRSWSKRSRMPGLTMSLRWTTPRVRGAAAGLRDRDDERGAAVRADAVDRVVQVVGDVAARGLDPRARRRSRRPCGPRCRRAGRRHSSGWWPRTATNSAPAWRSSAKDPVAGSTPYARAWSTIERPSGVSSASEDRYAARSSSSRFASSTGTTSLAWRLPKVIVPVLSSSRVLTSPAASTARPDIASTLCCTRRSMPAMPMADSSAPIVVGMRQTSSATSTTSDRREPE